MAILVQPQYNGSPSAVTITLDALATDSNRLVGRQSAEIDNSTNKFDDIEIEAKFVLGTSPSASQIDVWLIPYRPQAAGYATGPSVGSADAARTFASANQLNADAYLLKSILTDATTGRTYEPAAMSVKSAIGFVPQKFVIFVAHSTGVNLGSGNSMGYRGINYGV